MRILNRISRYMRKEKFSILGAYHQALVIAKDLRGDEKQLHKLYVRMIHDYSEDRINKLIKEKEDKVARRPDKAARYKEEFDRQLLSLSKEWLKDIEGVIDLQTKVFGELDKMVEFDDGTESRDLLLIGQILMKAGQSQQPLLFTKENIERFQKTFKALEKKVVKDVGRDYKNDIYEEKGGAPKHLGFLTIHKSDSGLAKAIIKADKKLGKEDGYWKFLGEKLQEELDKGVQPDFLVTFEGFVDEFGEVEQAIETIRHDIQILIHHHVIEHNKEAASSFKFMSLLQSSFKQLSLSDSLKEKLDVFYGKEGKEGVGKKAEEFANKEARAERMMYGEIERDDGAFRAFMGKVIDFRKRMDEKADQITNTKAA